MEFLVKVSDISKELKQAFPKVGASVASSYVNNNQIESTRIGRPLFVSKNNYFKIINYYFGKFNEEKEELESIDIKYNKNSEFLNNWTKCKAFAISMKLEFSSCVKYELEFYLNEMQIRPEDLYKIAPTKVKNKLKKFDMI